MQVDQTQTMQLAVQGGAADAEGAGGGGDIAVVQREGPADDAAFGAGVYRYKRTPLPDEVAKTAAAVAGV